jgi:beta-galactosidase GanA
VDFDLEVQGEGAEVRFHQDVFVDGHERFAREKQFVRDGQRWQLSYEIGVPDESGQLVVQLYARTVRGEVATIRFHRAELSMLSAPETSNEVVVIVEEVSSGAPH